MEGFILTRHWRDTSQGVLIDLWLSTSEGAVKLTIPQQAPVFFVRQQDSDAVRRIVNPSSQSSLKPVPNSQSAIAIKPLDLKNYQGESVVGVYCQNQRQLRECSEALIAQGLPCWEADIRPPERFLMERFITSSLTVPTAVKSTPHHNYHTIVEDRLKPASYQPDLRVVSIDIETSMNARELYSIAAYSDEHAVIFMVSEHTLPSSLALDGAIKCDVDGEVETEVETEIDGKVDEQKANNNHAELIRCASARACLVAFLAWIEKVDPDILIGWHVVQFDCWVLAKLCERWNVPFTLGRAKQIPHWRADNKDLDSEEGDDFLDRQRRYIQVAGRVVLDGIELLRTAFYHFDSFSLQFVANALLGDSKLLAHDDRGKAITDLFLSDDPNDVVALAKYNLHDCKLVWDIFEKTKLLNFAIERSRLTGMPLDKMGGSVASFEYAYLPKMHRQGYVAPNLGELVSDVVSPGGYVMNSRPGLYQHVLVLDFKSLYPSIIRTFSIDPYAFWYATHEGLDKSEVVEGFNGAFFSREKSILPEIITELWQERDKAKAENNQPLSQAIKIIMNSFYGVLGSTGCRFFDPRVCSSITLRGHDIIRKSQVWIEQQGYQVIYGDTDSLFVWLGENFHQQDNVCVQAKAIGHGLAEGLNAWWQETLRKQFAIDSALEIEFETHYYDFLMPTIRGSEKGSKKRYAGSVVTSVSSGDKGVDDKNSQIEKEIIFKGLETVRTDWTPVAKTFQQTLYKMIFDKEAYRHYVNCIVSDVLAGKCDHLLVYRKRMRRKVANYEKSNPPHVKAAKKFEFYSKTKMAKGDAIQYVITLNGPEPTEYRQSPIDYQHYIDKQLKPIADSILCFLNDSFDEIVDRQMTLL